MDKKNILRTYALTFLTYDKKDKKILAIDKKIRDGGLIGKTFRKFGYTVKKNVIDVFIIKIPTWMCDDFNININKAKARLTEFYVKKVGCAPTIYGIVLEIYSPDFKNPDDGINNFDINQINPTTSSLQDAGFSVDEIWRYLDRASSKNEWGGSKKDYQKACQLSRSDIQSFRRKIRQYLNKKTGK